MSVNVMAHVKFITELSMARKAVLLNLADYANDAGFCWPSQESLSVDVGLTPRNLRTHIHGLVEDGWVRIISLGNGKGNSTRYQLNVAKMAEAAKPERARREARNARVFYKADDSSPFQAKEDVDDTKAVVDDSKGGCSRHKGGCSTMHDPSENHHLPINEPPMVDVNEKRTSPGRNKKFIWATEEEKDALRRKWTPLLSDYDELLKDCQEHNTFGDYKTESHTIDRWMRRQLTWRQENSERTNNRSAAKPPSQPTANAPKQEKDWLGLPGINVKQ